VTIQDARIDPTVRNAYIASDSGYLELERLASEGECLHVRGSLDRSTLGQGKERRIGRRRWRGATLVCLLSLCWFLMDPWVLWVGAQGREPWTSPVVLSEGIVGEPGVPARLSHPALAADVWGGVHVVWSAALEEDVPIGDTLFYASWDGRAWSAPVDVLCTPGKLIRMPKIAVDSRGWLHLVWAEGARDQVWYLRVPLAKAGSVQAWSAPMAVAHERVAGHSVAVDANDEVHLVFCSSDTSVYHTSSADGVSWSTPAYVGETDVSTPECRVGQSIDERGRLHVVWGQSLGQPGPVYYTRSDDGGRTWLPALELDRKDESFWEAYAPGRPNALTIGPDQVHLVWFGAPAGQRWHQWSLDGGDTWSEARPVHPTVRGYMEPPALAADSEGTLHLVSSGWIDNGPSGTFHTSWRDGYWAPPALVPEPAGGRGAGSEFRSVVAANGSQLVVAGDLNGFTDIWASSLLLEAPPVTPMPRPSLEPSLVVQPTGTPAQSRETAEAAPGTATRVLDGSPAEPVPESWPLVIGVLPVALLVGGALVVRRASRRN
jgi:hypothetical protein